MATHPVGMNVNNVGGDSSSSAKAEDDASAHGPGGQPPQQSNEEISGYSDTELKALLDEAITYKNPKDLEHKSETFKELLKRAETEERESNFPYIPFTSSGGGSLQNIFESVNSEPRKYSSTGASNPRRHHISGHGYGRHSQSHYHGAAGGHSGVGSGHHQRHRGGHGSGFVSGRQGEGGSLPSNVNTRSAEVHPFMAEMEAVPRRRGAATKNNSESAGDHETSLVNGGNAESGTLSTAAMTKAAQRSVAARGTSLGFDTDIPYAEMENMSVVINMGDCVNEDFEDDDDEEEERVVSIQQAKKVTTHQSSQYAQQQQANQQQQYRTNLKIDIDHGADSQEKSHHTSGSASGGVYEKLATLSGLSGASGGGSGGSVAAYEQVDKSIKLSLEPKVTTLDPMASAYMSMKTGRVDPKSDMIIVTPSTMAQSVSGHDREMSTDLDWTRSMSSRMQPKRQVKHKPKYERNMTTIVSNEIIGYRGEEEDLDRLLQFIESKENEEKQSGSRQHDAKGKGKNKGAANKKEQQGQTGGGKLKKSNSMSELRSCSKLDEEAITTTSAAAAKDTGVVLRQKATKNNNGNSSSKTPSSTASTTNNQTAGDHKNNSQSEAKNTVANKRGDRRSWGTEELQYLGESETAKNGGAGDSFIVDTNNNMSATLKKSGGKKQLPVKTPAATTDTMMIPTKTLGELPVNSVSMESLVSSSWANEEFHVVTKKRKSKKKQSIVVQPFDTSAKAGGRPSQQFDTSLATAATLGSQKSAKNRPNNLIASITNPSSSTTTTATNGGVGAASRTPANRASSQHHTTTNTTTTTASANHTGTNQSKSRRKSTSSMPPSDNSDCSDLDSVHSLPIESPSTAKSKASSAGAATTPNNKSKRKQQQGGSGVSYADITKTANGNKAQQSGNGAVAGGDSSHNSGPVVDAEDRDVKWPSIGGTAADEEAVSAVPEKPTWVMNGGVDEKLQKMSDIIKSNNQASVVRSTEVINVAAGLLLSDPAAAGTNNKLQKSKSVDNESSSGFNMNIDQYPSLEKTVKRKEGSVGATLPVASAVVPNGCVLNKETTLPAPPQTGLGGALPNGVAGKKAKLLSSIVSDNGHQKQVHATDTAAVVVMENGGDGAVPVHKGLSSNNPVLQNQNNKHRPTTGTEDEEPEPVHATGASATAVVAGEASHSSNSREKKMAVKTNNNLSAAAVSLGNNSSSVVSASVPAKDPQAKSSGSGSAKNAKNRPNSATLPQQQQVQPTVVAPQPNRPAVIILNDHRPTNESSDLTFGFDVNNQLLFGDFEEDEIRFLDDNVCNKNAMAVDQINTSDYNSYNSSMCSSSALGTSANGQAVVLPASVEGLVFDSHSNPNDDTVEELDVPPAAVPQPQSTPKQVTNNCSNCTRTAASGAGGDGTELVSGGEGNGMTLMKNSCVQTSLDNLIMAPELNNNPSVTQSAKGSPVGLVTVSDLESRNAAAAVAAAAAAGSGGNNGKKKKKGANNAASNTTANALPKNWAAAAAELDDNGNPVEQPGDESEASDGKGEGFNSIKLKLQQFALINAQFAKQAPMGWMCNQMNSFFNNHENLINFVGLAWEDLTHNKSGALKYYDGQ